MKVSVVRGGGLAGVVTTTVVESESLPEDQVDELRTKVEQSELSELAGREPEPADRDQRSAGADQLSYAVTVEDHRGARTVRLREDALPSGIRSLVAWIDSAPGREERIGPPRRDR